MADSRQRLGEKSAIKPAPVRVKKPLSSKLPVLGFILVLLASIAWVLAHATMVDSVTVRLCEHFDANIPPEKRMPVFLSEIAFDGYMWNRHAEKLGENEQWRLRYTDFDNAPDGREVHWNSAFAWYLRGLGELHYALNSGEPGASLRNSIYRMSIWANPILLVLALGIFSTLAARRFGPLCGTVIAIGMVSVPTFYEGFMPAYPDHHGIIAFALMGLLFGIAWAGAGWVQETCGTDLVPPHSIRQARHGMIFSAICGAAGLWISALSTAMVLGSIGFAALVSAAASRWMIKKGGCKFYPELWKTWALWGAGTSLTLYLIEYFPFHMGLRLEVNHPLYALAWIGGGWIVATISEWLLRQTANPGPFPWKKLIIPIICCLVLPVVIITGSSEVYIPKDPFMSGLWKNISELLPLVKRISLGGLTWQVAIGWFPILILAALVLAMTRSVGHGTKSTLICLIVPILCITGLQLYQVRWGMLAGPLYIALAGIVIPQVWKLIPRDAVSRAAGVVLLLVFGYMVIAPSFMNCFSGAWQQYRAAPGNIPMNPGQGLALLHRQMALAIKEDAGDRPVVLLSSPNSSCLLAGLGGFQAIGTLYWENVEGLKNAARALNAQSDEEALGLLKKHGATHISLMTWENFIEPYFHILYPTPQNPELQIGHVGEPGTEPSAPSANGARKSPAASFGIRALFQDVIPPFTRPLVFPKNDLTNALEQRVLLLRVAPEQTREEARLHLARFSRTVEDNPVRAEIELRELADGTPVEFEASAELGALYLSQRRYQSASDAFKKALSSPDPALRDSVNTLAIEGLAGAGLLGEAKQIAIQAASQPDATPNTLVNSAWFFCTIADPSAREPGVAGEWIARAATMEGVDSLALAFIQAASLGAEGKYEEAFVAAQAAGDADGANPMQVEIARQMAESFSNKQPWTPAPNP